MLRHGLGFRASRSRSIRMRAFSARAEVCCSVGCTAGRAAPGDATARAHAGLSLSKLVLRFCVRWSNFCMVAYATLNP